MDNNTTTDTDAGAREGTVSGTAFVVMALIAAALFVTFLLTGAPMLRDRTLELAPPPAPHQIGAGEVDGATWTALAHEPADDEPCLDVTFSDGVASSLCVSVRGPDLRAIEVSAPEGSSRSVFHGVVGPRVTELRFELESGGPIRVRPAYVDFGFPLGFFATELEPGTVVRRIIATDRDGEVRTEHHCDDHPAEGGLAGAACAMNAGAP